MKLKPTCIKLPLIALLSMGLVCAPLAVSADDDNRGWRGHYQQDCGKHDDRVDRRSDHHDYVYHKTHGHRDSCRTNDKHGHKHGKHHNKRAKGQHRHYSGVRHHYRDQQRHENVHYIPGAYHSSLAVLFYN